MKLPGNHAGMKNIQTQQEAQQQKDLTLQNPETRCLNFYDLTQRDDGWSGRAVVGVM